jgi:hypothetical protein
VKRIEFTLSMPGRSSWNGRWSGDGTHYAIVRTLTDKAAAALLKDRDHDSWGYAFGDGWFASVEARVVPASERLKKSASFCGYDWMVESILACGQILTRDRRAALAAAEGKATP